MQKGLNLQTIKQNNRASILYLLNEKGPMSRKQIAEELGLTKAALTKITASLLDEALITEKEAIGSGVGRKEILLDLNFGDSKAMGVTFERDEITISIASLDGSLCEKDIIPFTDDFRVVKEKIISHYEKRRKEYKIIGIGISIIGFKDDYGIFHGIDLAKELKPYITIPIYVKNNVQAFSQAEIIYGDSAREKNVLLFKWGPGIGSSFIREGRVLSGDDSGITEIGHMIVNPKGRLCRCGRVGCLETETALDVIKNDVYSIGYNLTIEEILSSKDAKVLHLLDEKLSMVCLALLNASTILNANRIVLFGGVFQNEDFLNRFINRYKEFIPNNNNQTIVLSKMNDRSSYIGSTAMVSRKLFFER